MRSMALLCTMILALAGCDDPFPKSRYQISQVGGETYLLNTETGQVFLRQNGRFVEMTRIDQSARMQQASARTYSVSPINNLAFNVVAKVSAGKVRYKVMVQPSRHSNNSDTGNSAGSSEMVPVDAGWQDYWKSANNNFIRVNFQDRDGFPIVAATLYLAGPYVTSATRIVGPDDDLTGYLYEGVLDADPDLADQIAKAYITYSLDKRR